MELTQNQTTAIKQHSKPMLVSASAGSGKTFAMVQRAIDIIKNNEATIDELLIVTFTSAAALEMKQRLYDALKSSDDTKLNKQLQDFSQADISSIDSFCQKILKKYFFEIDLSPNFNIIDEMEANYLKNQALTRTFQSLQKSHDRDFELVVEVLTKRRKLQDLSTQILDCSNFVSSLPDKEYYYNEMALSSYNADFEKNSCFMYLINSLDKFFTSSIKKLENLKLYATNECEIMLDYLNPAVNIIDNALKLKALDKIKSLDTIIENCKIDSKAKFKLAEQKDMQSQIKGVFDNIKKTLSNYNNYFEYGNENKLREKLDIARDYAQSFVNIVKAFEQTYEKIKQDKCVLDFSDLERKTLQILQNEQICDSIAKHYKFLFIDEFQDTNHLQFAILGKLCKYAVPFFVGDPKQSIYGFRNSSPEILLNTLADYKQNELDKTAVNFIENFRSDKSILDFANYIFCEIMTPETIGIDYNLDGKFDISKAPSVTNDKIPNVMIGIMAKADEKENSEIEPQVYSVLEAQNSQKTKTLNTNHTDIIASYIKSFFDNKVEIYDKNLNANRPVQFSDFVILLRQRSSFDLIVNKLSSFGFPVSVNLKLNLLDSIEVKILHNFLVTLSNSFDDIALTNYLLCPICDLSENELVCVRLKYQDEQYFYSACLKYSTEIDDEISQKLKKSFENLKTYRTKIQVQTISQILVDCINKFDLENKWLKQPNGADRIGKVNLFVNILESKSFNSSLQNYLDFVSNYKNAFEVDYSTISSENSIKIMTFHNSKGLEFPITILGDMGKKFNKSKSQTIMEEGKFGVAIDVYNLDERTNSPTFIKHAILKYKQESEIAEQMRLLYVAVTRAKNYLGIFGDFDIEKYVSKSLSFDIMDAQCFLEWVLYPAINSINPQSLETQSIMQNANLQIFKSQPIEQNAMMQQLCLQPIKTDLSEDLSKNYLYNYPYDNSLDINIKNSVSKLLTIANQEKNITTISEFLTEQTYNNHLEESSKRGTAYHSAMELIDFYDSNFANQIEFIRLNMVDGYDYIDINHIQNAYNAIRPFVTANSKVYKEHKFMLYVPYNKIFKDSKITDKILVQGIIDIFIQTQNEIILIDYKTNATTNPQKLKEKYKLQLELYKFAISEQYHIPVRKFIYSFTMNKLIEI